MTIAQRMAQHVTNTNQTPTLEKKMPTKWIRTEPNKDGSITIKGKTYPVISEDYEVIDGFVLECDMNHGGSIYFTDEVAKKYGLEAEREPAAEHKEFVDEWGEEYDKYTHWLGVNHYYGTINGDGEFIDRETPWGECYTEEMWLKMNGIKSKEFFAEPDVWICGWCDG